MDSASAAAAIRRRSHWRIGFSPARAYVHAGASRARPNCSLAATPTGSGISGGYRTSASPLSMYDCSAMAGRRPCRARSTTCIASATAFCRGSPEARRVLPDAGPGDLSAGRGKLREPGCAYGDGDCRPRARRGARAVRNRAGRAGSLPVRCLCGRATASGCRARCVWRATRAGRADVACGGRLRDVRAIAGLCRARRGADRPGHRGFGRSDGGDQGARRLVRTRPGRVRDRHRDGARRARQRAHDVTRPGNAARVRLAGHILGSVRAGALRGDLDFPLGAGQAARPWSGANPAWRHCIERPHSRVADLLAVRSGGCDAFDVQLCRPGPLGRPLAAGRGRHGRTGPGRRAVPLHLRDGRGQRADRQRRQPSQPSVVLVLWLAIALFGTAGPVGYVVMCQMFPPEQTGRVSTAVNTLTLGGAFLVQTAIGWILDLWPRTASDGWDPDGYSWALMLTAAFQALAALMMATAHRRGHAISM